MERATCVSVCVCGRGGGHRCVCLWLCNGIQSYARKCLWALICMLAVPRLFSHTSAYLLLSVRCLSFHIITLYVFGMRKCVWWVNQHVALCIFATISQMTFLSHCLKNVRMMRWDFSEQNFILLKNSSFSLSSLGFDAKSHQIEGSEGPHRLMVVSFSFEHPSNDNYIGDNDDNNTNGGTKECACAYHRRPQHHQSWRDLGHVFVSRRPMHGWIGCFHACTCAHNFRALCA